MILVVDNREGVPKLTDESVHSAVESRLRSARLYSDALVFSRGPGDGTSPFTDPPTSVLLQIYVNTIGNYYSDSLQTYSFNIGLSKRLLDLETEIRENKLTYQTTFEGSGTREDVRFKLAESLARILHECAELASASWFSHLAAPQSFDSAVT